MKTQKENKRGPCMTSITMIQSTQKAMKNICKLLKPNSVIIIDNASYHSRNAEDFPVSKWRKAQFQSWLTENKIPFKPDALRSELWTLCKKYRTDKTSKVIDNIAKKYGHEVIRLPPYHCDLNATELICADEKNYVARENREMTLKSVEALFENEDQRRKKENQRRRKMQEMYRTR